MKFLLGFGGMMYYPQNKDYTLFIEPVLKTGRDVVILEIGEGLYHGYPVIGIVCDSRREEKDDAVLRKIKIIYRGAPLQNFEC